MPTCPGPGLPVYFRSGVQCLAIVLLGLVAVLRRAEQELGLWVLTDLQTLRERREKREERRVSTLQKGDRVI